MSQFENENNSGDLFTLVDDQPQSAVIKVFGCGGGGGNAVKHMLESRVEGVEFICANTDAQALRSVDAEIQVQLGQTITRGLGAGANPEIGRQSALEDREKNRRNHERCRHDLYYRWYGWWYRYGCSTCSRRNRERFGHFNCCRGN
jgi:cell division GTPase FtsZ